MNTLNFVKICSNQPNSCDVIQLKSKVIFCKPNVFLKSIYIKPIVLYRSVNFLSEMSNYVEKVWSMLLKEHLLSYQPKENIQNICILISYCVTMRMKCNVQVRDEDVCMISFPKLMRNLTKMHVTFFQIVHFIICKM